MVDYHMLSYVLTPHHIGCIDAIEPHLPTLIPYLITTLNDPKVRLQFFTVCEVTLIVC